jgi:hypothetical protein
MKTGRYLFITIIIATFTNCATGNYIPKDYAGEDVGHAIVSVGHTKETNYYSYKLLFRTKDQMSHNNVGYFTPTFSKMNDDDYVTETTIGTVEIMKLPPGDYEIYNVEIFENLGMLQTTYSAKNEFSIPFQIKPNETQYLGEFIAVNLGKKFLDASIGGAYFILDDKMERDINYIKKKNPDSRLGNIINIVPDPEAIGCPLIRSDEMPKK